MRKSLRYAGRFPLGSRDSRRENGFAPLCFVAPFFSDRLVLGHSERVYSSLSLDGRPCARLSQSCINALRTSLEQTDQEEFTVTFEPHEDSSVEFYYMNALPQDAALPTDVRQLLAQQTPEKLR